MAPPGPLHEGIINIFRQRPDVLRKVFPNERGTAAVDTPNFSELSPSNYTPDLIVLFKDEGVPQTQYVLEAQLWRDEQKRWSWPLHAAAAHALRKCRTFLVVVTPSLAVARWAKRPIDTLHPPFVPLVLGPEELPESLSDEEAREQLRKKLAMVRGEAHRHQEAVRGVLHRHDPGGPRTRRCTTGPDDHRRRIPRGLPFLEARAGLAGTRQSPCGVR